MLSLENYLTKIYTDFANEISRIGCFGQMKELNYINGNVPNYNNRNIQQFYLLKYAYAYTYEYYIMFQQALHQLGKVADLEILSVGCGALIDYKALREIPQMQGKKISYVGVDKVNWNYKPEIEVHDQVILKLGDGTTYFQTIDKLTADIYMFPKSICEFSVDEINRISSCFSEKMNMKDRFCVCVSLRNTPGRREEDLQKVELLEKGILAGNYVGFSKNYEYYVGKEYRGICAYERNYKYPDMVLEGLSTVGTKCNKKNYCSCFQQCESCMKRSPILKTGEICYKVMIFERRGKAA